MTQSFSKSIIQFNNSGIPQDLHAHLRKHNTSSKPGNLIFLKSKENSTLDFTFNYTSEQQLARVVKHVRRRRQQIHDENKWKLFNEKRLLEEDIQDQNQFSGNNTDTDGKVSHLPNLIINADKIIREEVDTNDSEGNDCAYKIDKKEETLCKCIVSKSNTTDFKYVQLDSAVVSEDLNPCLEKQENLHHNPQKHSPFDTQDSNHKEKVWKNENLGNGRRKCQVPGPLSINVLKKMEDLVTYINKIRTVLSTNQNEFIDSDVAERNLKRLTEFTNLFARNYLYRIQRQKKEAKKIFFDGFLLSQDKLAMMYQTAVQALQVYERHLLKTCIYKRCIQQLEQIFDFITFLISLTEKVTEGNNFLHKHELVTGCIQLKSLLTECAKDNLNVSSDSVKINKHINKPNKEKQKKQDKLAMYASSQPKPFWKKTSAKLAKAKFGPPSDRKNLENPKKGKEINATRLYKKKSREQITKNKVSFEEVNSFHNCGKENQNVENEVKFEKRFRHETRAVPEEEVVTMMEILKPQINDESDEEERVKFISTTCGNDSVKISPIASEVFRENSFEEQTNESSEKQKPACSEKKNSSASWPKNIRMVCIKADDISKNLNHPVQSITFNDESKNPVHQLIVSDTDRKIALGFKALVDSFSPYDDCKPWDILSRVSDEVVFDVLENVCQSLEIDDVIQKLYNLEFK